MNKIVTLIFVTLFAGSAFASDVKFTNADGSPHTDICIAAATSKMALAEKAKEHGYSKSQLSKFNCNGLSIKKFAKKYTSSALAALNKPLKVFSFDNDVGNVEADICIAAARSNESFEMIKSNLAKPKSFYKRITCNNMPLSTFAKKYGNKKFRI
jgi:hypothetical protein